jgi:hypothetical protein
MRKGRLPEGRRTQAPRGDLLPPPPRGDGRGTAGEEHREPDAQAQRGGRGIWAAFAPQGSLPGWWRALVAHALRWPMRPPQGGTRGPLAWPRPKRMTWHHGLPPPISAGASRWGSRKIAPRQQPPGRPNPGTTVQPPASCEGCLTERFPASISWQRFAARPPRWATPRRRAQAPGAARDGPSGGGGLLRWGRWGRRLAPRDRGQAPHRRYPGVRATMDSGAPGWLSVAGALLADGGGAPLRAVLPPAALAWRSTAQHA